MTAFALLGLDWARPLGLAALALPLVVWWLARRARGGQREPTGTLEIWREVAGAEPPRGAGRRTSPALWCWLAALSCGALALAGPRTSRASAATTWRVVVDRSPSMYLPLDSSTGVTRIARAHEMAQRMLARLRRDSDVIEWCAAGAAEDAIVRADTLPPEWLARALAAPEPRLELFDAPATLLLTDRALDPPPLRAGFVASGGDAVPGPIADAGRALLEWDGERVTERPLTDAERDDRIEVAPELRATPIGRAASAWAASRELRVAAGGGRLVVARSGDGASFAVRAGRDGWLASGRARAPGDRGGGETWLATRVGDPPRTLALVRWSPGRVDVGWSEVAEPEGDSAAFAVSWARLFDAALLPARGVVSLDERRAAGEPAQQALAVPEDRARESASTLAAWLAAAAAVLAGLALWLRR